MKYYIMIAALIAGAAQAQTNQGNSFELMSDQEVCEQFGDRCPKPAVPQQQQYPSFYGSGPVREYVPPQPAGSFSRGYMRNVQLVQMYDPSCNCVRLIGMLQ